jgi:hypothetical protein
VRLAAGVSPLLVRRGTPEPSSGVTGDVAIRRQERLGQGPIVGRRRNRRRSGRETPVAAQGRHRARVVGTVTGSTAMSFLRVFRCCTVDPFSSRTSLWCRETRIGV